MKQILTLLLFFLFNNCIFSAIGHFPIGNLGYTDGNHARVYSSPPNYRQAAQSLNGGNSTIAGDEDADIYVLFDFDTFGKSIFMVYTTDGSEPGRSTGGSNVQVTMDFSKFDSSNGNRWFYATIPAVGSAGTTVKYVFYISDDSNISNSFGRIDNNNGYQTTWNDNNNVGFPYTTQALLPIVLTKFTSTKKNNEINLDWQTTSELNNSHFEIEQSTDSKTWKAIGKATGAGTTDEVQNYSYTDKTPNQGINYYRLKQVDYDGAFDYSSIVSVVLGKDESINIYPIPVADQAVFEFQTEQKKGTILSIYNINGQLVKQTTLNENSSMIEIILSDLVTGMYFLQTTTNKTQIVQRFIKQ